MKIMRVFEKRKTSHYLYYCFEVQVFKLPFFDSLSAVEKLIPVFTLFKSCLLTPKKPFLHFISLSSCFVQLMQISPIGYCL